MKKEQAYTEWQIKAKALKKAELYFLDLHTMHIESSYRAQVEICGKYISSTKLSDVDNYKYECRSYGIHSYPDVLSELINARYASKVAYEKYKEAQEMEKKKKIHEDIF